MLRSKLLEHSNLVRYAEKYMTELVEVGTSSMPSSSSSRSSSGASSSTPRRGPYNWSKMFLTVKYIFIFVMKCFFFLYT